VGEAFDKTISAVPISTWHPTSGGKGMQRLTYETRLGILLVISSLAVYSLHYAIFRDARYIFEFMLCDIAFLFIQVLLVIIILQKLLDERERSSRLEKLNTVIGVFFSEVGTELLTYFSNFDPNLITIQNALLVRSTWSQSEFNAVLARLGSYTFKVAPDTLDLEKLRDYLASRRDFLLLMMENPNLIEHERFTELLRALFHVAEELKFRSEFHTLPETDVEHLARDIDRAYALLASEWMAYMRHLKDHFPYFFSLAMRTNPFDRQASVIVGP
jgi:hypothetical protein